MSETFALKSIKTSYDPERKEWSAPRILPLYHPNVTVGQLVITALSAKPQGVGQICHEDGHQMKNWQILRDSVRAALNLRDLGMQEGDVLGFVAANTRNVAPVIFGALINKNPLGTVNPILKCDDIAHMFEITRPKLVVCDEDNYKEVKRALRQLNNPAAIYVFNVGEEDNEQMGAEYLSVRELLKPHAEEVDFQWVYKCNKMSSGQDTFLWRTEKNCDLSFHRPSYLTNPDKTPAFILGSSGTTGRPKAIFSSHAGFAYYFQDRSSSANTKVFFGFSAPFWATGVAILLQSTLNNVPRVIVKKSFEPRLGLEIIKKHQIEFIMCTPVQIQLMLQDESYQEGDLSSLRAVMCGGSIVPQWLQKQLTIPIITGYGLSEGGGISMSGQLSSSCVVRIVDDDGKQMGPGEQGEICVKPYLGFKGYYGDEESGKNMMKDGFMHTGDIGVFDERGNLQVVDRKKEIFKNKGIHVCPSDIEKALLVFPGISLICVVGIPHEITTNVPAALVVRTKESGVTQLDIHKYAKQHLQHYKWLRGGVYFVDDLPMTPTGKIIRREATKQAIELFKKNPDVGFEY